MKGAGLGTVLAVLDGRGSQDTACKMIADASAYVVLSAFTFDRAEVVTALVGARQRGVEVSVLVDRKMTLTGTTRDQLKSLQELAANGVRVQVCSGQSYADEYRAVGRTPTGGLGIQHSKVVLTEEAALIGSTNWTTASRANVEVGLKVVLDAEEHKKLKERLLSVHADGVALSEAEKVAAQKSRSASPVRRRRA